MSGSIYTRHVLGRTCHIKNRPNQLYFVHSLGPVQLYVTPWTAAHQASLSFTISWSLLKLMAIESVMLSNHLVLCCPLLLFAVYANYVDLFVYYSTGLEVGLLTQRDGMGREEGGGFRMGNMCIPVADSIYGKTNTIL